MPRYIAKTAISHGQGSGADKKSWNISKGQSFDPSEMNMPQHAVDGLLSSKRIKLNEGGEASMAKPVATPVTIDARTGRSVVQARPAEQADQAPADPKSSVGVTAPTAGSTQGGKTAPTGGSTQGGKAPGA